MFQLHAIGGLPRSGSTLLCNLLNQHPHARATGTSHVPAALAAMTAHHSRSHEVKSELILHEERTLERIRAAVRGYVESWHDARWFSETGAPQTLAVFDKSRLWNFQIDALRRFFPDSKAILIVRDLRHVVASCEKQNAKTAEFNPAANMLERTMFTRSDSLLSPEGTIGSALRGVEDAIRRYGRDARVRPSDCPVMFVQYEKLTEDPERELGRILDWVGLPRTTFDIQNVRNVTPEVDALYLHKFPHDGTGPVRRSDSDFYDWISPDVEELIIKTFPVFNGYFGYGKETPQDDR